METSQTRRYITPTLQANWNLAISDVIRCLNAGETYEAWLADQTLYGLLPPEREDLKEIYTKVRKHYETIKKNLQSHATDSTSYQDVVTSYQNGLTVLTEHVRPFFQEMYELLYRGKYLETSTGPRIEKAGHL